MNPDRAWLEEHGWTTALWWSETRVRNLAGQLTIADGTWSADAMRSKGSLKTTIESGHQANEAAAWAFVRSRAEPIS